MQKAALMLWLALSALVLSGCCTMLNFREENDPKLDLDDIAPPNSVYGGLRIDSVQLCRGLTPPYDLRDAADVFHRVCLFGLLIADLPLSAVADTFTLPLTIHASSMRTQDLGEQVKNPKQE